MIEIVDFQIVLSQCHVQWINLFAEHFGRCLFETKTVYTGVEKRSFS